MLTLRINNDTMKVITTYEDKVMNIDYEQQNILIDLFCEYRDFLNPEVQDAIFAFEDEQHLTEAQFGDIRLALNEILDLEQQGEIELTDYYRDQINELLRS